VSILLAGLYRIMISFHLAKASVAVWVGGMGEWEGTVISTVNTRVNRTVKLAAKLREIHPTLKYQ